MDLLTSLLVWRDGELVPCMTDNRFTPSPWAANRESPPSTGQVPGSPACHATARGASSSPPGSSLYSQDAFHESDEGPVSRTDTTTSCQSPGIRYDTFSSVEQHTELWGKAQAVSGAISSKVVAQEGHKSQPSRVEFALGLSLHESIDQLFRESIEQRDAIDSARSRGPPAPGTVTESFNPPTSKPLAAKETSKQGIKRKFDQVDRSEDWIGLLYRHTQMNNLPPPKFTPFFDNRNTYSCSVVIHAGVRLDPRSSVLGTGVKFGSGPHGFPQDAKWSVAKLAVLNLRSRGFVVVARDTKKRIITLPQPGQRPSVQAAAQAEDPASHPPPTPKKPHATQAGPSNHWNPDDQLGYAPNKSDAQKVHELALALGFMNPAYRVVGAPGGLFDASAVFPARAYFRNPPPAGNVGSIEGVASREEAKRQCCRKVLLVLQGLQQERALNRCGH